MASGLESSPGIPYLSRSSNPIKLDYLISLGSGTGYGYYGFDGFIKSAPILLHYKR